MPTSNEKAMDEDDDTDGRASPPPAEQLEQRRITAVG